MTGDVAGLEGDSGLTGGCDKRAARLPDGEGGEHHAARRLRPEHARGPDTSAVK